LGRYVDIRMKRAMAGRDISPCATSALSESSIQTPGELTVSTVLILGLTSSIDIEIKRTVGTFREVERIRANKITNAMRDWITFTRSDSSGSIVC